MRRTTTLTAALGLALVLTACGADEETTAGAGSAEGSTTSTEDTAATSDAAAETAEMSDPVCAGFFQTGPVTLAERAEADRDVLESGQVLDPASWGEINLLSQRIEDLVEDASGDQATVLERINAPFVEASDAVLDDEDKSPTDAEIEVPEIDVTDAAAAQEELQASCAG